MKTTCNKWGGKNSTHTHAHTHQPLHSHSLSPPSFPVALSLIHPTYPNCPTSPPLPVFLSPLRLSMLWATGQSCHNDFQTGHAEWKADGARGRVGAQSMTEGCEGRWHRCPLYLSALSFTKRGIYQNKKKCRNKRHAEMKGSALSTRLVIVFKVASPLRFAHERQIKDNKAWKMRYLS